MQKPSAQKGKSAGRSMCGITGLVNWGDREVLASMTAQLAHRGPDDSGVWESFAPHGGWIGLGNRRLAILDLSPAGHMPMSSGDGKLAITYNGELYNSPELRRELQSKGRRFHSHSDTEVVLQMYESYGSDCLTRFSGIFAFAIVNSESGELFLARDHFGVKPLYYMHRGNRLAFSSELKALLRLTDFNPEFSDQRLADYLTYLWVPDPLTIFREVKKLPAAHYATFRNGELRVSRYWHLAIPSAGTRYSRSAEDLTQALRTGFDAAVKRQLLSDAPVGAFLSSGLDSSSIVASMAEMGVSPLRTYTATFPEDHRRGEDTLDDPAMSRRFAAKVGAEHHEVVIQPDVARLLPKLIFQMDEPVADPAVIACYSVCKAASEHCKVLLSGVGGDEVFAGYRRYAIHRWNRLYRRIPKTIRHNILEPWAESLSPLSGSHFRGPMRLAKKMIRNAGDSDEHAALMNLTYMERSRRQAISPRLEDDDYEPWAVPISHLDEVGHADFLHQLMYLDMQMFLVSLNLNYTDKMSMACSVEVRVPFLDRELVEMTFREIPPSLKMRESIWGTDLKYILRRAMAPSLPDEVLRVPKAGFGAPINHWLRHELQELSFDTLSSECARQRGVFAPVEVNRILEEHLRGSADHSFAIWQLLTFELWAQAFLDRSAEKLDSPRELHHSNARWS